MTRAEKAKEYFLNGYSCSQSIVKAFADLTENPTELIKVASSFGGGFGRLREVCGAFSGTCIIVGSLFGYEQSDGNNKLEHYALIRDLAEKFKTANGGSYICRELIAGTEKLSSPNPADRTEEYKQKRPCASIVYNCAEILEQYLTERGYTVNK